MFGKKYAFTIKLNKNGIFSISHNFDENADILQIEMIATHLANGNLGRFLLDQLEENPHLKEFSATLRELLYPLPVISDDPIVKPSDMINRFIGQLKGSVNE